MLTAYFGKREAARNALEAIGQVLHLRDPAVALLRFPRSTGRPRRPAALGDLLFHETRRPHCANESKRCTVLTASGPAAVHRSRSRPDRRRASWPTCVGWAWRSSPAHAVVRCSLCPELRARCATPKRCCSSITTRPRFLNTTRSSSNACVPTRCGYRPFNAVSKLLRSASWCCP
jgi:hypothetical protein